MFDCMCRNEPTCKKTGKEISNISHIHGIPIEINGPLLSMDLSGNLMVTTQHFQSFPGPPLPLNQKGMQPLA